jgi:hypothetical protein
MRAKEQTLSRQKRREARGKREARGASFPGTAERPLQRKQVFAAALKRINKELERLRNLAARTAHVEAARQALALRRAANFIPYPSAGATASEGMAPHPSRRRKTIIEGAKIGRVITGDENRSGGARYARCMSADLKRLSRLPDESAMPISGQAACGRSLARSRLSLPFEKTEWWHGDIDLAAQLLSLGKWIRIVGQA